MDKEKTFLTNAQKNSVDLLYDDKDIMIVSIDLLHENNEEDLNRNGCNISHETIVNSMETIKNKPIIFRYDNQNSEYAKDVTEHAHNNKELFNTRIGGIIPNDSRMKFIKRDNGKTYLNVEGIIYKKYEPQLVNIIKENDGELKVSIEIMALGKQDKETGGFIISEFVFEGVALLGRNVEEGIEGSHLEVLKFTKKSLNSMNKKYLQFSKFTEGDDIFSKIKNKQKENLTMSLTNRELEKRLWTALGKYEYSDGDWKGRRYYIVDVDQETNRVIVEDNQTDEYYSIPYEVSENGDVKVEETERKRVLEDKIYREIEYAVCYVFEKDEFGKGAKIVVDKSKEAVSDNKWGEVNKTSLRNKVLEAENYKDLVKDVYLVVADEWEENPSESLKYPVMEIIGDKAVYNRDGLASALGYAKANNEEEVVKKLEEIYDELDLDEDKDSEEEVDNAKCETEVDNDCGCDDNEPDKDETDEDSEEDNNQDNGFDFEAEIAKLQNEKAEIQNAYMTYKDQLDVKNAECEELKAKLETAMAELGKYKAVEEKAAIDEYYNIYSTAMDESDKYVIATKIENATVEGISYDEIKKMIDEAVLKQIRKLREKTIDKAEIKNSKGFIPVYKSMETEPKQKSNNYKMSSDEILKELEKNKK